MQKKFWAFLPLTFSMMSFAPIYKATVPFDGRAYDATQQMDFTDSTKDEINAYYSPLDDSSTGEQFRKELYDVISKNNYFVQYGSGDSGVNQWYKITDRNWALSREINPATYRFSQDKADNYYLSLLYFQDNSQGKAINSYVNGFKVDKNIKEVDFKDKKKPNATIQEDKEHIWAKSHGFSPDGDPAPGAGTDLHHLLAADHKTNNIHNNNYYGNIDRTKSFKEVLCYYADGTTQVSGWIGEDKDGDTTFEPTDMYKGDIARALLYMGVRYSDKKETNTREEPYLLLTDDKSQKDDNAHFHGVHQHLSDFLEWNEKDPVSDYEVHRNNLIYKNVQRNRNPFIDHPEWARRVYDPAHYLNFSDFSSLKASYNLHVGDSFTLPIKLSQKSTITLEYDKEVVSIENNTTVKALKEDENGTDIKFHEVDENGNAHDYQTKITIKKPIQVVLPSTSNWHLVPGVSQKVTLDVSNLFSNEKVSLVSKDPSIVEVKNDNELVAVGTGEATIEIVVSGDYGTKTLQTFKVKSEVENYFKGDNLKITIIVIVAIVVVLILVIILAVTLSKKSKRKLKRAYKKMKKNEKNKK